MSRVRARHTAPEKFVRSLLHREGFRFRLHAALPGTPDISFVARKRVVFVHGCFWHGHHGCRRGAPPVTNTEFWRRKLEGNKTRDRRNRRALARLGYKSIVVWECELKDAPRLRRRLVRFLKDAVQ